MDDPRNESTISAIADREDLGLKLRNLSTINKWINTEQVLQLKTLDFLLQVQQTSLRGTDVIPGVRPDGVSSRIMADERIEFIAPETQIETLLTSFSDKVDSLLAQPEVNPEALKVWATTVLIGIHPFRDRNGTSARALMAFIDRKRGLPHVEVADSSDNAFKFQNAHEGGLDMMRKIFLHEMYPQFRIPLSEFTHKGNKSKGVTILEHLASQQGKSYDDIVKELVRHTVNSIDKSKINDHPIVKEAAEVSDSLRFDRSNIYREYKQRGIATYPIE